MDSFHAFDVSWLDRMGQARHQQGFVLIVGLIVLLVLTILGITAMRGTTLETAMVGNMQDRAIAFQNAEAALRFAEEQLDESSLPGFGSQAGYFLAGSSNDPLVPRWQSFYGPDGNVEGNVVAYSGDGDVVDASFFIEKLQRVVLPGNSLGGRLGSSRHVYRVTAQSTGRNPNTVVVLQSTVIR